MIRLYICLECGKVFEEPVYWTERHGFSYGPYEEWYGSPCCYGGYTRAYECDYCGELITDDYIKIEDRRYCQNCYTTMTFGEE